MSHSSNTRRRIVQLGWSRVEISFPRELSIWFEGLRKPATPSAVGRPDVTILAEATPDRYRVTVSGRSDMCNLPLGDALATAWEGMTFLLLDDMRDGLALHAAALGDDRSVILLPGASGAGKTHLALWFRARGYCLETDEVYALGLSSDDAGSSLLGAGLRRPIMLKLGADAKTAIANDEEAKRQLAFSQGALVRLDAMSGAKSRRIDRGFVIFPSYTPGIPLTLKPLTPGEAGLRLMGQCVNARNLPHGGLAIAAHIGRKLPAVALQYGASAQLGSILDVLTRQVLTVSPSHEDLTVLCAAFSAKAAMDSPRESSVPSTTLPAPVRVRPAETTARFPRRLSIGMATFDDYDGVYFTLQAIRTYNSELAGQLEFIVVDNNPTGPCAEALKDLEKWIDGYRYIPRGDWSGTAIRNVVFEEASSEWVLCLDSHVLVAPGALTRLIAYLETTDSPRNLLHGPLVYDDLKEIATHFAPVWRGGMYGVWGKDPRGIDPDAPPFEIPMQGLGLFAYKRAEWPGFSPAFRGFGGEEGYLHEKVRQRGGKTLCLPFLRWIHRFNRPLGAPYANKWEDRIRNYLIGFAELGMETFEMEAHFAQLLGKETSERIFAEIRTQEKALLLEIAA